MSDILWLDTSIKKQLLNKIDSQGLIETKKMYEWLANNGVILEDRDFATNELKRINNEIVDNTFGLDYLYYILRTEDLITKYREMSKNLKQTSFVKKVQHSEDVIRKKKELIFDFILIAQEYMNLENVNVGCQKVCTNEDCKGTQFDPTDDPSVFICKQCFVEYVILDDNPAYKDVERVKMSSRYVYTTESHFRDAMNNFECKQTKEFPKQVLEIIKKEIKKNKLSEKTIKKSQLYNILEYLTLNIYYEDINLIYFKITGVEPYDITDIRSELLSMHKELDEVFNSIKEHKESSLNINFQLFKFLQLLDFNCTRDDFFFIKTPANEKEYYDKWKILIELLQEKHKNVYNSRGKLKWRYIPYY